MAKQPKAPRFQDIPTLEGLAARRRQSVTDVLAEWGVSDEASALSRCRREGVRAPADVAKHLPKKAPPVPNALVSLPPKAEAKPEPKAEPKAQEAKVENAPKSKLTSDATADKPKDPPAVEPAPVAAVPAGPAASKA